MPRRYWLRYSPFIAVTAFVAILGGVAAFDLWQYQANETQEARAEAADQQRIANGKIAEECSPLELIERIVCTSEKQATYRESERSEKDLQAQQNMVRVALWMATLTWVQALIGIAGIAFVAETLRETRKANEGGAASAGAAMRSASAAYDAASATREAAHNARVAHLRDVRPWVRIAFTQAYCDFRDETMFCLGVLEYDNIGRSPAVELRAATKVYPITKDGPDLKEIVKSFVEEELTGVLGNARDRALVSNGHGSENIDLSIPINMTEREDRTDVDWRAALVVCGAVYKSLYEDEWRVAVSSYRFIGFLMNNGRPHNGSPNADVRRLPGGDMMT